MKCQYDDICQDIATRFFLLELLIFSSSLSLINSWLVNIAISTLIFAIYEIVLTTRYGGTIGKILMKIKVVDEKGNFVSYYDSIVRYVSKWLSILILGIGHLMIIWTSKKQGLHDKIAETYVTFNSKSKINDKLKKILIILTIFVVAGYILYVLSLIVVGGIAGVQTTLKSVNEKEPIKSILSNCDSKFPHYKDICISLYAEEEETDLSNSSMYLELCSHIKDMDTHRDCVLHVARLYDNQSICSNARSRYNTKLCEKTLNFSKKIYNFFHPKVERTFNESLKVQKVVLGLDVGKKCIETNNNKFVKEDVACFEFINVSDFEKNQYGNFRYDIDVKVYDKDNNLVRESKSLIKEKDQVRLKGNTIEYESITSRLKEMQLGTYRYELIIYDRNSKKGSIINKTIEMIKSPKENLQIKGSEIGLDIGDSCVRKIGNIFTPEDTICIQLYNVSEFARLKDDHHLFEFGMTIINSSGDVVYDNNRVYNEDGYEVLRNNVLDGYGVKESLKKYNYGIYQFKITVYDRVSKKQASVTENVTISKPESNENLYPDNFEIGYYDGRECITGSRDKFAIEEIVCLKPEVHGFEEDANGNIWFNMDQSIFDSNGNLIDESKDNFGANGDTTSPPLAYHYVYFSLYGLAKDRHTYEVTIHDNIGKKSTKVSKIFYIVDREQLPKNDPNDFFEIYYGAARDLIDYNQTKTYLISGNYYEITLSYLKDGEAQFIVNGMTTKKLKEGEYDPLFGNFAIRVAKIVEPQGAQIYLGFKKFII